jgi:hypothetical protein
MSDQRNRALLLEQRYDKSAGTGTGLALPFLGIGAIPITDTGRHSELTGPNVKRFLIAEKHLAVQFDERLHEITLHAIEDLAR